MNNQTLNDYLYHRDNLLTKHKRPLLDWPTLTFAAGADDEPFQEMVVITLRSYYDTQCHEFALEQVPYTKDWEKNVHSWALKIIDNGTLKVREMVVVDENYEALVVVDDLEITDLSINKALSMLERSKIPGITYFSDRVSFTLKQMLDFYEHCQQKQGGII